LRRPSSGPTGQRPTDQRPTGTAPPAQSASARSRPSIATRTTPTTTPAGRPPTRAGAAADVCPAPPSGSGVEAPRGRAEGADLVAEGFVGAGFVGAGFVETGTRGGPRIALVTAVSTNRSSASTPSTPPTCQAGVHCSASPSPSRTTRLSCSRPSGTHSAGRYGRGIRSTAGGGGG